MANKKAHSMGFMIKGWQNYSSACNHKRTIHEDWHEFDWHLLWPWECISIWNKIHNKSNRGKQSVHMYSAVIMPRHNEVFKMHYWQLHIMVPEQCIIFLCWVPNRMLILTVSVIEKLLNNQSIEGGSRKIWCNNLISCWLPHCEAGPRPNDGALNKSRPSNVTFPGPANIWSMLQMH